MRFDLINALLDLRALILDPNEGLNGRELGIQPGGDQPHRRAERALAGILELVLNHAGSHQLPTSTSAVLVDLDQVAAIVQAHPRHFLFDTIQASHHVGLKASCGEQNLARADPGIAHEPHVRAKLPLQHPEHTAHFSPLAPL